jgi:signal transduction histidine kinase/CheY-like chemotaxis protein
MSEVALAVEALFALVFGRALVAYLRTRDPLDRDVTVMFSAMAMLFVIQLLRLVFGRPPELVNLIVVGLLMAQPFLTLRLVNRLSPVPSWLFRGALVGYLCTTWPMMLWPGEPPRVTLLAAVLVFFTTELLAGLYLAREGRNRSGSSRIRLHAAAAATALFAVALLVVSIPAFLPTARSWGGPVGRMIALVSVFGYLLAFLPPRWLRRVWSAGALYTVGQRLLRATATESPQQIWQLYAETAREVCGADAAVVLVSAGPAQVREVAAAGTAARAEARYPGHDLRELLAGGPGVPVETTGGRAPRLAVELGQRADARYASALSLRIPPNEQGGLVLLDRRRNLFSDDDLVLVAELGGQAGIIAERAGVLAEQERLSAELTASVNELTVASQAKTDFLSSMSHELRTPLNAIIGFSELMRGEEELGERRVVPPEWIEHIYSSGRHLLGLINDILDLAKVEAGRIELRLEALSLNELVEEAVTTLQPLVAAKGLTTVVEVPPLEITADRTRFWQILNNLLSNAIKFTPEGGRITVRGVRVGSEVSVTVIDTGVGISAEDQERVFEEFRQVGDPRGHQAGTGLGLALTRRLAELHGGRVELRSEIGLGSEFTVTLPDPVRPDEIGFAPAAPGRRGGILVVEDDPGAARLLRTYLEDAGHSVRVSPSGEAALSTLGSHPPEAIVLDVLLPGMDGWELLRRIKRDPTTRDIPVVIVSVCDEHDVAMALGAVDYFVKPIDREMLLGRLSRHALLPPRSGRRSRVLVISGEEETRRIIEGSLAKETCQVLTTSGGTEGLALAREQSFDLVICDLLLPDVDGFSVVAALDSDVLTRSVPVLVLSADDIDEVDKARLNGKILGVARTGDAASDGLCDWLNRICRTVPEGTAGPRQMEHTP